MFSSVKDCCGRMEASTQIRAWEPGESFSAFECPVEVRGQYAFASGP
jgi:hypothetical protein